jgi:hypothetical protein
MKIFLQFQSILKKIRKVGEPKMEIMDVTMSSYSQQNIQIVFKMQEVQMQIN